MCLTVSGKTIAALQLLSFATSRLTAKFFLPLYIFFFAAGVEVFKVDIDRRR